MNKILVSDFDGTLYRSDDELRKNIIAIQKFQKDNNLFVIATGRSYDDFNNINKMFNIPYDYIILNNGAIILDKDNNILINKSIDNTVVNKLQEVLRLDSMEDKDFAFCCSKLNSRVKYNQSDLTKIAIYYKDSVNVMDVKKMLIDKFSKDIQVTIGLHHNQIEIVGSGVSKASAIKDLINVKNVNNYQVFVIGDNDNDYEMIKKYNGVCMNSATHEIKEISKYTYDNVYSYIEIIK